MVTIISLAITFFLTYKVYKWCKKHPCDEGFAD